MRVYFSLVVEFNSPVVYVRLGSLFPLVHAYGVLDDVLTCLLCVSFEAYADVEVTDNVVPNFWACSLSLSSACALVCCDLMFCYFGSLFSATECMSDLIIIYG